jgi:hypothetical protein
VPRPILRGPAFRPVMRPPVAVPHRPRLLLRAPADARTGASPIATLGGVSVGTGAAVPAIPWISREVARIAETVFSTSRAPNRGATARSRPCPQANGRAAAATPGAVPRRLTYVRPLRSRRCTTMPTPRADVAPRRDPHVAPPSAGGHARWGTGAAKPRRPRGVVSFRPVRGDAPRRSAPVVGRPPRRGGRGPMPEGRLAPYRHRGRPPSDLPPSPVDGERGPDAGVGLAPAVGAGWRTDPRVSPST